MKESRILDSSAEVGLSVRVNESTETDEDEIFNEPINYQENVLIAALNPYSKRWDVVPIRIGFYIIGALIALVITFRGFHNLDMLGCAIGAIGAPLILRVSILISENWIFLYQYKKKQKAQYPMVTWLSFTLFMDCVYYFTNPNKPEDCRLTDKVRDAAEIFDHRKDAKFEKDGRFYFDFVADTGDGFNATYSVANLIGKKSLKVTEHHQDGTTVETELPRAKVLVHGGDICYPFPTYENFLMRFVQPFGWAFPKSRSEGESIYFACGNHEYMDGNQGFRKFLLPRENIGGWKFSQQGTYCALKLPQGWWAFIIDLGPEPEDIDEYQLEFFDSIEMDSTDKIILVYHVPDWIKCGTMGYNNMEILRMWRRDLGDRVRLVLAGDLHYYRRMEVDEDEFETPEIVVKTTNNNVAKVNCVVTDKQTFVIAGHGGGFGHSTDYPAVQRAELKGERKFLEKKCDYPEPQVWKNIFAYRWPLMFITTTNHIYSRVLGAVYMILFMGVYPNTYAGLSWTSFFWTMGRSAFFYYALGWLIVTHFIMVTANYAIPNFSKLVTAGVLITIHTMLHVLLAFVVRYGLDRFFIFFYKREIWQVNKFDIQDELSWLQIAGYTLSLNLAMYLFGTIFAPFITACYFAMSIKVFDWHYNEAISMLQHPHHKGFCRFAINSNGDLDMYSIVVDRYAGKWKEISPEKRTTEEPAKLQSQFLKHHLLERVTLKKVPKARSRKRPTLSNTYKDEPHRL